MVNFEQTEQIFVLINLWPFALVADLQKNETVKTRSDFMVKN